MLLELLPRLYQRLWRNLQLLRNGEQVRLVGFEEADQRHQEFQIGRSRPEFVCPDSGQVEEPSGPPFVGHSRPQRHQRQSVRISWRVIAHSLMSQVKVRSARLARILIVEDNALNVKLFCDLLSAHGHEARPVTDGRFALDQARDFAPDLVITDIQLPHVSGLELIRLIRQEKGLKDVPIMAVTAYAAASDEERIRAAGAQAYVSKPISVSRFVAQVNELLGIEEASRKAPAPEAT